MSFKPAGISLILLVGLYTAYLVKKSFDLRVDELTVFVSHVDFYINSVSFTKSKAGEITDCLLKKQKGKMKEFYKKIQLYFETNNEELLINAFKDGFNLKPEDEEALLGFFQCLGKSDYQSQIQELKFKQDCIKACLEKAVHEKNKNQRSGTMLTLGGFLAFIIFLV